MEQIDNKVCTLLYLHDGNVEVALFKDRELAIANAVKRIEQELYSVHNSKIKSEIIEQINKKDNYKVLKLWSLYQNTLSDSRLFQFLDLEIRKE